MGTSLALLVHPEDLPATLAAFAGVMDAPLVQPYAYRILCKDKSFRWVAWNAVFEDDRVYASGRDITAEKEKAAILASVEATLRQSQKMEAIEHLAGGIAHDFNNVLAIIKTSNDLLRRVKATDDRGQRFMD